MMIYFDNAATGLPKSIAAINAMKASSYWCGNAGRSAYPFSVNASRALYECREKLAILFGSVPENVVLCHNATFALNMAIKGLYVAGSVAITSNIEHNAVMRPLYALEKVGAEVRTFDVDIQDDEITIENFKKAMTGSVSIVVVTHASNVFGRILPIERMAEIAHEKKAVFIADASQTVGYLPFDFESSCVDVACIPGHKGLYGPLGTGALIVNPKSCFVFQTLVEGGTGVNSLDLDMPEMLPERLEAGTANAPAFAGLSAACEEVTIERQTELFKYLIEKMSDIDGVMTYGAPRGNEEQYVPMLLLRVKKTDNDRLARKLTENGICIREGLHCSPAAHRKIGTGDEGGIRVSIGKHNTKAEVDKMAEVLLRL